GGRNRNGCDAGKENERDNEQTSDSPPPRSVQHRSLLLPEHTATPRTTRERGQCKEMSPDRQGRIRRFSGKTAERSTQLIGRVGHAVRLRHDLTGWLSSPHRLAHP